MTVRRVYSPKVYAFTKNAQGEILNISPYVVSGEIIRNINQPSTASLVLRNPQKIFTTPANGVAIHPQDPITIYMDRLAGYPVKVFTGYLDQTPYLQLQPSVVQLQATCTLKRLLYSFFDPSLPYMISFFEKYGWVNTGQGSIIAQSSYGANNLKQNGNQLANSSISRLLWGILYDIGDWDDTNIYIEPIPTGANGIVNRVLSLMQNFNEADPEAIGYLDQFFNSLLGAGGNTSNISTTSTSLDGKGNIQQSFNFFVDQGLPAYGSAGIVGNFMQESSTSIDPTDGNFGSWGIAQWSTTRHNSLISFCQKNNLGNAPLYGSDQLGPQLKFVWYELTTDYTSVLENLRQASSPGDAATIFCGTGTPATGGYENPGDPKLQNRIQYAQQVYDDYANATAPDNTKPGTGKSTTNSIIKSSFPSLLNDTSPFEAVGVQKSAAAKASGTTTYQAMIEAANAIASEQYPYIWGGGHSNAGTPSVGIPGGSTGTYNGTTEGYDCSGSVGAVLSAAGFLNGSFGNDASLTDQLVNAGILIPGTSNKSTSIMIWDNPSVHIFMRFGGNTSAGRYWGTADGSPSQGNSQGGPGWLSTGNANPPNTQAGSGYKPYYIPNSKLIQNVTYQLSLPAGSDQINDTSSSSGSTSGDTSSDTISQTSAQAFVQQLDFPSIEDSITAIVLGAQGKGLMHDQSLMPFVQQVAQASLRSFMSLPDGSFYAFYPDYFGEMGQHNPYWLIDDIEITGGTINITDDALATHVYAIGENSWPIDDSMLNELFSAGTVTIFNAFTGKGAIENGTDDNGLGNVMGTKDALNFIKRYGARPLVQEYPMVRSGIFEMLMAYQLFMQAWSNQFLSTFTFTFMPELFPGGKVGFPSHGIMMYINQVTHTFDYTSGFTTTAQLSSPSLMPGASVTDTGIPKNMVSAMAEPVQNFTTASTKTVNQTTQKKKPTKPSKGVPINRGETLPQSRYSSGGERT